MKLFLPLWAWRAVRDPLWTWRWWLLWQQEKQPPEKLRLNLVERAQGSQGEPASPGERSLLSSSAANKQTFSFKSTGNRKVTHSTKLRPLFKKYIWHYTDETRCLHRLKKTFFFFLLYFLNDNTSNLKKMLFKLLTIVYYHVPSLELCNGH